MCLLPFGASKSLCHTHQVGLTQMTTKNAAQITWNPVFIHGNWTLYSLDGSILWNSRSTFLGPNFQKQNTLNEDLSLFLRFLRFFVFEIFEIVCRRIYLSLTQVYLRCMKIWTLFCSESESSLLWPTDVHAMQCDSDMSVCQCESVVYLYANITKAVSLHWVEEDRPGAKFSKTYNKLK